jgi:NAD(P)-dependent dehydrogenase (short-subunit alcohol dehydrogenase family)
MAENMKGKVIVITGATSGIGQVAAEKLAGMGARIVQVARDPQRGQAALMRLNQIAPGISPHHSLCRPFAAERDETRRRRDSPGRAAD